MAFYTISNTHKKIVNEVSISIAAWFRLNFDFTHNLTIEKKNDDWPFDQGALCVISKCYVSHFKQQHNSHKMMISIGETTSHLNTNTIKKTTVYAKNGWPSPNIQVPAEIVS